MYFEFQTLQIQDLSVVPSIDANGDLARLVREVWNAPLELTARALQSAVFSTLTNFASLLGNVFPQDSST